MHHTPQLIHGTTVEVEGDAVLLLGTPGSGKSDLALRLIDHGAILVADDQTQLHSHKDTLWATAPDTLKGMFEIRQVGIHSLPYVEQSPLKLAIRLSPQTPLERLPEPETLTYFDISVPLFHLNPFEASTPAKIRLLLNQRDRMPHA